LKLYSIGHSNLETARFVRLLQEHGVSWLADLRSIPYSRWTPQFNRDPLSAALKRVGIRYLFMGDKLGGKPRTPDEDERWGQGRLNYLLVSDLSRSPEWKEGIHQLASVIQRQADVNEIGCLMCSEADPNNCHRALVAFELQQLLPNLQIEHVSGDSSPVDVSFQKSLFKVSDDRSDYH
jgi:uncharacterized protein (DUF488 family)